MKINRMIGRMTSVAMLLTLPTAFAQTDVARLGADLTPAGAEMAGNKAGTIPAWTGENVQLPGYSYGKVRGDFFKYKDDKPLYTIDKSNLDKYADFVTPGEKKMITDHDGYYLKVYPTRRSCRAPDFVQANTKETYGKSKVRPDGILDTAILPSVPFPIPTQGIEVIWNHLLAYRGVGVDQPMNVTVVSPAPGQEAALNAIGPQGYYWPWGKKGKNTPQSVNGFLQGVWYQYTSPAALAGQGGITRYYMDRSAETFYYFTGQRRVRRLPSYEFDTPFIGFEGALLNDDIFNFNGLPTRFNWKIIGKREIVVPANSFEVSNFQMAKEKYLLPKFINPEVRRYEQRRVWVVEGTVKQDVRHVVPKKVFYVDEDSWLIVLAEEYDAQGKIWKTKQGLSEPMWELGGACVLYNYAVYNHSSGRYVVDQVRPGTGKDDRYYMDEELPRFKDSFYTQDNLQSISER